MPSKITPLKHNQHKANMAFWAAASSKASHQQQQHQNHPAAGPARPLTYLLSTGPQSFADLPNLLVRLRVDVPTAAAALEAALCEAGCCDDEDEESAAQRAQDAACAIGQLHQVIRGIEQAAEDARVSSVLELLPDRTLQLLCSKAVVAKIYKGLLPHQAAVGYAMAPAKHCLSTKPVAAWDLQECLQTAVIKTLTGSSSGTAAACSSSTHKDTAAAAAAEAAEAGALTTATEAAAGGAGQQSQQQQWMCLSRNKLVGANMLAATPGQVSTTPFVELEVQHDAGSKGLLLITHAAGTTKFRLFSPMQALQQDAKALVAPLSTTTTDAELLSDPGKLRAAARQLDGRAVKLLPDERLAFIKSLTAAPTDAAQLQRTSQWWLGSYGLLLPPSFPFLVGVATHPEAEAAQMQVPSCCVLTNLGLSNLPGSTPGGSAHSAAVSRMVSDLQAAAGRYSFWGHKLSVQLKTAGGKQTGAGLTQANLQITQASLAAAVAGGAGGAAGAAGAAAQLKAYSLQTQWTSAADLSQLQQRAQAAAGAAGATQQQQQQQSVLPVTEAELQLMGLVEADGTCFDTEMTSQQATDGDRQQQQHGGGAASAAGGDGGGGGSRSSRVNPARWQGLKTFLQERAAEQQEHKAAAAAAAAGGGGGGLFRTPAAAAAGGTAAAPKFGGRKPAASKPASAAVSKNPAAGRMNVAGLLAASLASNAGATTVAGTPGAAGSGTGVATAAAGAAAAGAGAAAAKAPSLGKRPGADAAAGKPPAPKKTKAAGAGAAGGATAKPKAPKKTAAKAAAGGAASAAATAGGTAGPAAAAGADIPPTAAEQQGDTPAPPAAAAAAGGGDQQQQQQQRKRTKASDLDAAAVSSKVLAAFAASGGAALKGVSVPEMINYLRAQGQKGGSAKRADVEARLLALLGGAGGGGVGGVGGA